MKTHLIYHRADADGIVSAAVVCAALELTPQNSTLYGVDYPEACPVLNGHEEWRNPVIIVDYSYKQSIMELLLHNYSKVTLYDHHATAAKELGGLLGTQPGWIIDTSRAACAIVWDELMSGTRRPWWLELIAWRDLGGPWQADAIPQQAREAHALNAGLFAFAPLDPYQLAAFMFEDHPAWMKWLHESELQEAENQRVTLAVARGWKMMNWFPEEAGVAGDGVPCVTNVHRALISETCHQILKRTGDNIAGVWNRDAQAPYHYTVSLRSTADGPDVGALAKRYYGGGGRARAAGFTTDKLPI